MGDKTLFVRPGHNYIIAMWSVHIKLIMHPLQLVQHAICLVKHSCNLLSFNAESYMTRIQHIYVCYLYFFQIEEEVLFKAESFAEIFATFENVTIKVTYEFNTLNTAELIENITYNYDMNLTTIGNFSLLSGPEIMIFESTGKSTVCIVLH